jgi:3-oxoacyl-[acyl-carrier-protein] synthase-3
MKPIQQSIIISSGSYIPTQRVTNMDFMNHTFYDSDGIRLKKANEDIIRQFEAITGISERRYVSDDLVASDIAFLAARDALESAQIDAETLDYIIVAHNFGDISTENYHSEMVPSLAARVKHHLGIQNPQTIAYDLPFGCAGWLQGMIQADGYIRSGNASKVLIIGAETLSRICDPHDRDSMIYSDGAGAVILGASISNEQVGVLTHTARSFTVEPAFLLRMGKSSNPDFVGDRLFLKMQGHKLYEQVLKIVPGIIKECIDKAGLSINDIDQVLIHQANHKMDEAVVKKLYALYGIMEVPEYVMPMTISWLGNSSVATIPTLYDLFAKGKIENHTLVAGKVVVFVSIGAGLNVNALVYQIPANDSALV